VGIGAPAAPVSAASPCRAAKKTSPPNRLAPFPSSPNRWLWCARSDAPSVRLRSRTAAESGPTQPGGVPRSADEIAGPPPPTDPSNGLRWGSPGDRAGPKGQAGLRPIARTATRPFHVCRCSALAGTARPLRAARACDARRLTGRSGKPPASLKTRRRRVFSPKFCRWKSDADLPEIPRGPCRAAVYKTKSSILAPPTGKRRSRLCLFVVRTVSCASPACSSRSPRGERCEALQTRWGGNSLLRRGGAAKSNVGANGHHALRLSPPYDPPI